MIFGAWLEGPRSCDCDQKLFVLSTSSIICVHHCLRLAISDLSVGSKSCGSEVV